MSTMQYWWLAALNTSRIVLTTKDNKKDDSYPAADCYCRFQLRVVCKKAQMETSQTAHGHPKTVIDNRHEHTQQTQNGYGIHPGVTAGNIVTPGWNHCDAVWNSAPD